MSGCVKLMTGGVCRVWWRYLTSFLSYGKKSGGGRLSPPPPSGRGLKDPTLFLEGTVLLGGVFENKIV